MTPRSLVQQAWPAILMLALLLLASAFRFHRLGEQSLWYDEGVAAAHATRTLPELIPLLQRNVHVPAYFTLLGFWEDLAGSSEFALRLPSAFFSILSVAGCFALGSRLFHPIAGISAAAFVALNSFSIYYAQEARMYAMLSAVAAASMWFFSEFMRAAAGTATPQKRFRSILLLGGANALGMYTHIAFALVILAQALLALMRYGIPLLLVRRGIGDSREIRASIVAYAATNLLTLLCFAPWLDTALSQVFAQPNLGASVPLEVTLRQLGGFFAFGNTFEFSGGNLGFAAYFFLLFGLITTESRGRSWWTLLLPPIWVLVSVFSYLQMDLGTRYLRFLLPVQLGFALWMGRGVWVLWTRQSRTRQILLRHVPKLAAALATGAFLIAMLDGLPILYHHADFQRDDVRGLVARIESDLNAGDAIVVSAPGFAEVLGYYYRGAAPVYGLPRAADDDRTRADVNAIIADHQHIDAIFYGAGEQDPRGVVEATLNRKAFEISDEWIGDLRYVQYAGRQPLGISRELDLRFGDHIRLRTAALNAETLRPGEILLAQFVWSTDAGLSARYKVFLQLLNAEGVLVAQRDSEPGAGSAPTTSWPVGELVTDNHALRIPSSLPAGSYRLIVGLYDIYDANARLRAAGETFVELGTITVE